MIHALKSRFKESIHFPNESVFSKWKCFSLSLSAISLLLENYKKLQHETGTVILMWSNMDSLIKVSNFLNINVVIFHWNGSKMTRPISRTGIIFCHLLFMSYICLITFHQFMAKCAQQCFNTVCKKKKRKSMP